MKHRFRVPPGPLLAVAIVIDVMWVRLFHRPAGNFFTAVLIGLVFGQLNAVTIWVAVSNHTWRRRMVVLTVAVLFAALLIKFQEPLPYPESLGLVGSQVALTLICLGPMVRFQRASLATGAPADGPWQFSLRYLMVSMTVMAILLASLAGAKELASVWPFVMALVATSASIGLVGMLLLGWIHTWPIRWAIHLGVAVTLGAILGAVHPGSDFLLMITMCVIQTLALEIGLTFSCLTPTVDHNIEVEE